MQRQILAQIDPWHVHFFSNIFLAQSHFGKSLYCVGNFLILVMCIRYSLLKFNRKK